MPSSRSSHSLVVALLLLSTVGSATFAGTNEWSTEGPYGGNVRSVAVDPIVPSRVFVGTESSGIWQSLDYGQTWNPSSLGQIDIQIRSVTTHPFEQGWVYSVAPGQVTRSIDFGNFWEAITVGLDAAPSGPLAIDPQSGTDIYLGTNQDGVYKSTDSGSSWAPSSSGLPEGRVTGLVIDPSNTAVVYAALENDLVWKSTDAGATWALTSNGIDALSVTQIALDPHQPSVLYAATRDGVFKTTNGGAAWNAASQGLGNQPITAVAVDPRFPGVVYAGTLLGDGVFRSFDGGATWTPTNLDRTRTSVNQFAFDPEDPERLYLAESRGGGLYRSTDGGASWQERDAGILANTVADFAVDPTTATAYAAVGFDGVARSTPEGGWEPLPGSPRDGYCCDHVAIDPQQPQTLYAGGLDGMFKSVDGGATWQTANTGLTGTPLINDLVIEPGNPDSLYLSTVDGVFRTLDRGANWSQVGGNTLDESVWSLTVAPGQPPTVLAATFERLYRSTDGGTTWIPAATLPPGFFVRSVAFDPTDPQVVWVTDLGTGIYKSTDGGQSLFQSESVFGADPILVDPEDSETVFVGTAFGVWWTEDGGDSWEPFEGGIDDEIRIRSLALSRGAVTTYYAGAFARGAYTLTRGCEPDDEMLCIDDVPGDRRFAVTLFFSAGADSGDARAISLEPLGIDDGGILYFFTPQNPEVLVKVINGCGFNDRYWVFAAATTTLGFALEVEDTRTRVRKTYLNPDDRPADTITDIDAFAGCDTPPNEFGLSVAGPSGAMTPETVASGVAALGIPSAAPALPKRTVTARDHDGEPCVADATTLCIDDEPGDARFEIRLHYDTVLGGGLSGDAAATPLAPLGITDGGIFSFFDPSNPEVLVKIIDGCGFNDAYWVFSAASTNLGFALGVRDTHTGTMVVYTNADTRPAATVTDIDALFVCDD